MRVESPHRSPEVQLKLNEFTPVMVDDSLAISKISNE